jgi:CYTH domain-containing protein
MSATEIEGEISEGEFSELLSLADKNRRPITKVRHAFYYKSQLFEVDVYPEWTSSCIMETELPSRDTAVEFPPFINIIKDVTGEKKYSNASMAKQFPPELTLTL